LVSQYTSYPIEDIFVIKIFKHSYRLRQFIISFRLTRSFHRLLQQSITIPCQLKQHDNHILYHVLSMTRQVILNMQFNSQLLNITLLCEPQQVSK